MSTKETKYRVDCPLSNQPEYVYIRSTQWNEIFLAAFNGCDNNWHSCEECEVCRKAAQAQFNSEHPESPSIQWHTP